MKRSRALLVFVAVSPVLVTACAYHDDPGTVHLTDPGKCVPVDLAAGPDTATLLEDAAVRFNGSSAARLRGDTCVVVRVQPVDAPVALRELAGGWPDTEQLGPAPVAWVPGSMMWGELLNERLAKQHRPAMAPNGTPFARTPLVVALPAPMARALGSPNRSIGWNDFAQAAADPRGWGAYGHPEWGAFQLGKGNPHWSTTGLDATIAIAASPTAAPGAPRLEQSVVYYGDTTQAYFANWRRLATKSPASALRYLSAAVTDERSVVAYNTGHQADDVSLTGHASRQALPLVAIYPEDAAIESDNPIIVLNASWSSADARAGARLFTKFALQNTTQAKVAAAGFRPGRGAVRADLLSRENGVDGTARNASVAPASPVEIEHALTHWQAIRRRGNVLVLFDVSDSMGDPADPQEPDGPTKIARAQPAMSDALDQLAPDDRIGLRVFTTELPDPVSPNWFDVVARGTLAARRPALEQAIAALTPKRGSPLYSATRDAYDAVAQAADRQRINGVLLLTDGHNEDDHDNDRSALLEHLAADPSIRVFTVAYSNDADLATLEKIAQATNAWNFDVRDTRDIADQLPRALASF